MHDPDMGDWKYDYDRNGNLTRQTDANNNTISLTYDELNRVTLKDYPTGTDVQFIYDEQTSTYSIGRLTAMIDASGTTTFNYDYMGRPATMTKHIDGLFYTITNGYENARLTSVTYPDGEIVRYTYGTGSELSAVRNGELTYAYAVYPAAEYTALSQPTKVLFGNGVETKYDFYAENNRLKSISTMRSSGTETLLSLAYEYSAGGNIKSIDDLVASPSITSPGMTTSYTYTTNDKPHAVRSSLPGGSYDYDNNGNMVSDRADHVKNITYDYDNRLQSVINSQGTTTFVYDGTGTRVKKIGPNGEYVYIGKYYQCKDGMCIKYIYGGGALIANKIGTDIEYYHQDHLGSTRVVTNDISEDMGSISYYPFGETLIASGALWNVDHKYTSQELDSETDLYFYNARYYNPALGRFISADTIVPEPGNSQSLNRYSYVYNNPLNFNDPTGHWRFSVSFHFWVGFHYSYDSKGHHSSFGVGAGNGSGVSFGNAGWNLGGDQGWYVDYTLDDRHRGADYFEGSYGSKPIFEVYNFHGKSLGPGYGGTIRYYPDYGKFEFQAYLITIKASHSNKGWSTCGNSNEYFFESKKNGYSYETDYKALNEAYERDVANDRQSCTICNEYDAELDEKASELTEKVGASNDPGYFKSVIDSNIMTDMAAGPISKIFKTNGLFRAALGVVLAPTH
jgi:RHS repeat-associated protein